MNSSPEESMPRPMADSPNPKKTPVASPESKGVLSACGCITGVAALFASLVIAIVLVGVHVVNDIKGKRAEAARLEADKLARENAERQAIWEREAEKRQAELAEEEAMKQQQIAEAAEAQRVESNRVALERERQLAIIRQREEQKRLEEKRVAEREQDEQRSLHQLQSLSAKLREFRFRGRSEFLVPNGGEEGRGLSWRVHLLPFLGQKKLYENFRLNEPWDSDYNKKLIPMMPEIFGESRSGKTRVRILHNVDGEGWPYLKLDEITDGLDQTISVVRTGPTQAIEWTKPDDLETLNSTPLAQLLDWELTATPDDSNEASQRAVRVIPILNCQFDLRYWPSSDKESELKAFMTFNNHELISLVESEIGSFGAASWKVKSIIQQVAPTDHKSRSDHSWEKAREKMNLIGQAMREYKAAFAVNSSIAQGGEGLSWRVHLLPYLGAQELYEKFHLDEPWDSLHNFALLQEMPDIFWHNSGPGRSPICIPVQNRSSPASMNLLVTPIQDDPDATTLYYLSSPSKADYWTKPDCMTLSTQEFAESLGWKPSDPILAGTYSGKSLLIPANLHLSKLKALISPSGQELFDVNEAFVQPQKSLRRSPSVSPATPIVGLVPLPDAEPVKLRIEPIDSLFAVDSQRLRQVAVAIHNYENTFKDSPTLKKTAEGKPSGLSWRVHLLPFLDQQALYQKFALNEPWDSPTNLDVASVMPAVFGPKTDAKGTTDICSFSGKGSLLNARGWMASCTDSISNTLMLVQVSDENRVPWTKPQDIELNESLTISGVANGRKSFLVATGDGVAWSMSAKIPQSVFLGMATTNGGEIIDAMAVRRLSLHQLDQPLVAFQGKFRAQSNRLQLLAQSAHNYESAHRVFPPGRNKRENGELPIESYMLSWRVHILPYIGQEVLYSQFRLNEPWDSWHNKQLIPLMPDIFRDEEDAVNSTTTRIQVVVGNGTPHREIGDAPNYMSLEDGPSNTLMMLIVPPSRATVWTMPSDYEVDLNNPDFAELHTSEGLVFATYDGAVRRMPPDFSDMTLKALMTIKGGEVIDPSNFAQ